MAVEDIRYIDINCDVGEGVGNEKDILRLISSCSIACGGHTGDESSMRSVVRMAVKNNVRIGAHPSYPDKENFGRCSMPISDDELSTSIQNQLAALTTIVKDENAELSHIKPHGALYNDLVKNVKLATVFLDAIAAYKDFAVLYVPFDSVIEKSAIANGFRVKYEAFADRNYNSDLSLVSRKHASAMIIEPQAVLEHIVLMVRKRKVRTLDNREIDLKAETFCLHGDTPNALGILKYLVEQLTKPEVNIRIAK